MVCQVLRENNFSCVVIDCGSNVYARLSVCVNIKLYSKLKKVF